MDVGHFEKHLQNAMALIISGEVQLILTELKLVLKQKKIEKWKWSYCCEPGISGEVQWLAE